MQEMQLIQADDQIQSWPTEPMKACFGTIVYKTYGMAYMHTCTCMIHTYIPYGIHNVRHSMSHTHVKTVKYRNTVQHSNFYGMPHSYMRIIAYLHASWWYIQNHVQTEKTGFPCQGMPHERATCQSCPCCQIFQLKITRRKDTKPGDCSWKLPQSWGCFWNCTCTAKHRMIYIHTYIYIYTYIHTHIHAYVLRHVYGPPDYGRAVASP